MNLVKMIIAPIFFCTVVPGIASSVGCESVNRILSRFLMCALYRCPHYD
jgi:Na+/H+-dicarboxylate symporter